MTASLKADFQVKIIRKTRVNSRLPGAAYSLNVNFKYSEPNSVSAPEIDITRHTFCAVDIMNIPGMVPQATDEMIESMLVEFLNNYAGNLIANKLSFTRRYGELRIYIEMHRSDAPTVLSLGDGKNISFTLQQVTLEGVSPDLRLYLIYQLNHPDQLEQPIGGRMMISEDIIKHLLKGDEWFEMIKKELGEFIVNRLCRRSVELRAIRFVNNQCQRCLSIGD